MTLTIQRTITIVTLWAALFFGLSLTHFSPFGLLNIVGFPFMVLVPGYLTVLVLKFSRQRGAFKVLLGIGFSLIELIFLALLGNTFLPLLGVSRPLDTPILVIEIGLLVTSLLTVLYVRSKKGSRYIIGEIWQFKHILPTRLDKMFALLPLIFVGLSIMGATSLNNGGSNIWTLIMLIGAAVYLGVFIYYVKRLHINAILIALFFVGLALLFMTSLRGWYITGHDIQHEFRLFLEASDAGKWGMGITKDAYNACLSITILPTVFYKLLDVQTFYVFKVLFQLLFALAPCIVFLINRTFVSKQIALLATLYFISFPTFFGDMPMLNRQEIALLFVGIGLLILFNRDMPIRAKRMTFIAMSFGVIVSHYATNYTMLALLAVCAIGLPVLQFMSRKMQSKPRLYKRLNLSSWRQGVKPIITIPMVVLLLAASFMWSVQLTKSSDQLGKVFADTISHIQQAIGEDSPSENTYFSYNEVSKLSDQDKLYRYFEQLSQWGRERGGQDAFYDEDSYSQYTFPRVVDQPVPLTPLGVAVNNAGVPVEAINSAVRNNVVRYMQLMVLLGVLIILFSRRVAKHFPNEFRLFQIGSVALTVGMLALPVLLADYDLSRMLQQLLFVLGIAVVAGSMYIVPKISDKIRIGIASTAVLILFTSTTGVLSGILGGYNAQLHLYNSGIYYDLYYTHLEERLGAQWLNDVVAQARTSDVQTDSIFIDRYTNFKIQSVAQQNLLDDVYPGLVRKDSYVLLGSTTVKKEQATAYYNGSLITYKYPIEFLDNNKNLLYDNGGSRVYK